MLMSFTGQFITDLQREQKIVHVSAETEQHLKYEFRKLSSEASHDMLAAAVETEISPSKDRPRRFGGFERPCWT
jgi:hypothetical protein